MSCGINAGSFINQLTIQINNPVADTSGGRADNWSTLTELYVAVKFKSGGESFQKQKENTQKTLEFTTWFDESISPDLGTLRLVYRNKVYDFLSVENIDGMNQFMKIRGSLLRDKSV